MSANHIEYASHQGIAMVKLVGEIRANDCPVLDDMVSQLKQSTFHGLLVNLTEATFLDSTALGLLAKLGMLAKNRSGVQPVLFSTNADITTLINSIGLGSIYLVLSCRAMPACLATLPQAQSDQKQMLEMVLDAHRTLSDLSDQNQEMFAALLNQLEQQCQPRSSQTDCLKSTISKPALTS